MAAIRHTDIAAVANPARTICLLHFGTRHYINFLKDILKSWFRWISTSLHLKVLSTQTQLCWDTELDKLTICSARCCHAEVYHYLSLVLSAAIFRLATLTTANSGKQRTWRRSNKLPHFGLARKWACHLSSYYQTASLNRLRIELLTYSSPEQTVDRVITTQLAWTDWGPSYRNTARVNRLRLELRLHSSPEQAGDRVTNTKLVWTDWGSSQQHKARLNRLRIALSTQSSHEQTENRVINTQLALINWGSIY